MAGNAARPGHPNGRENSRCDGARRPASSPQSQTAGISDATMSCAEVPRVALTCQCHPYVRSDFSQRYRTETTDIRRGSGGGPQPAAITIRRRRPDILTSNADKNNGYESAAWAIRAGATNRSLLDSGNELIRAKQAEHELVPMCPPPGITFGAEARP
jgi:hypothetical protein